MRRICVATLLALCASAGLAVAQDAPAPDAPAPQPAAKDPAQVKRWLAAAETLVARGDHATRAQQPSEAKQQYENAVTAYQHAIDAGGDNAIYYSLGLVEEKLGENAAAYRDIKLAADPKSGVKPDLAKKAQAKLDDLAMKIGLVTLVITPDGTTVTLAGKQVGQAPMAEPLALDPGTYTLSFAAVGFQPKDSELKVDAGAEIEHKVALEPIRVVVTPVEPATAAVTAAAHRHPDRRPLYIGAGVTGGLVVVATITGIAAIAKHSTFTDPGTGAAARRDAQRTGRTLAHVTDACLVGAIGAAAFTTYWYLYRYSPEARTMEHDSAKLDLVPWVQPDAGGIFAAGSF